MLFNEIVFGPIMSRRFGKSLGINLLPLDNKICNFNCIYCECGWTDLREVNSKFTSRELVVKAMSERFFEIKKSNDIPDSITFAGNGEPTMHPDFAAIIDHTIRLRDEFLPGVKIVVLSNSALLGNQVVFNALNKVDARVMKLDAGTEAQFVKIDQPLSRRKFRWYIDRLKEFKGNLYIQTLFLRGRVNNENVDNTKESEIIAWINILKEINPIMVMIYSIDRETPAKGLEKISNLELEGICQKVIDAGIPAKYF